FLDEIGDLPLGMQTSLLRVLQEKEITRLGESTPRRVDARVIAATHQDLDELVRTGRFRKDLLYRIRVARITIPPLRDRRDDIPPLVEVFLREAAQRMRRPPLSVSDEAMRRMLEYDWPGNVRELQSAIESACIVCRASVIQVGDLPPELHAASGSEGLSTAAHEDPRTRLLTAIRVARGRRTTAAHLLGVSRATFYRRLKEFRVSPDNVQ
ncbi:MAG: sigma-54-dependent Fis family transcriptional regulator, partial [Planctomycetaceae bacterium]|nr:sigma-54-dependent Fis family transcriptional regulator [Planctomycetaceae bacterium]